eukprot:TRINITY_DN17602_c0_g1_i1.p1 TRINITY_DN17602_c0_g1~~TRINITY_DN17602_c0_g1_i1.p1  ORF type:complete len:121 (+),score=11.20 TRINITY_DN17602_c0_g1_i1:100-462(+)
MKKTPVFEAARLQNGFSACRAMDAPTPIASVPPATAPTISEFAIQVAKAATEAQQMPPMIATTAKGSLCGRAPGKQLAPPPQITGAQAPAIPPIAAACISIPLIFRQRKYQGCAFAQDQL